MFSMSAGINKLTGSNNSPAPLTPPLKSQAALAQRQEGAECVHDTKGTPIGDDAQMTLITVALERNLAKLR